MNSMVLREAHARWGAVFTQVNQVELPAHYGDWLAEHSALTRSVGLFDLSFRGRLCLTGADRARFLHGQVTNDINALSIGQGCYAALLTAKGKLQSDLYVYCLEEELLLDLEPGLSATVAQRLETYIVADDVQVVDAAPLYGLLSAQGPRAEAAIKALQLFPDLPQEPLRCARVAHENLGELYLAYQPRLGGAGYDLFAPSAQLGLLFQRLVDAAREVGGRLCGFQAFEAARVETGIPRFGADMDERRFPQECGIEDRAVSYTKGCYLGQEILNRIHTRGHVNRQLCSLRLSPDLAPPPVKGDKVYRQGREVGEVTSVVFSPRASTWIALGCLIREASQPGTELVLRSAAGETAARVTDLPRMPAADPSAGR